eukprot:scaffold308606_cov21-Prasinocladus_malaysianus.AAC.1
MDWNGITEIAKAINATRIQSKHVTIQMRRQTSDCDTTPFRAPLSCLLLRPSTQQLPALSAVSTENESQAAFEKSFATILSGNSLYLAFAVEGNKVPQLFGGHLLWHCQKTPKMERCGRLLTMLKQLNHQIGDAMALLLGKACVYGIDFKK